MRVPGYLTIAYCHYCGITAKQRDLWSSRGAQIQGSGQETSWHMYHALSCLNCQGISFVDRLWVHPGPMIGDATVESETFYPQTPFASRPAWLQELSQEVQAILHEVYRAADNQLFSVAAMGARTVIDITLTSLVGDIGGFEKKLDRAIQTQKIESKYRAPIMAVIESGHASAHRGHVHTCESFGELLSLLEQLLVKIHIAPAQEAALQAQASRLKAGTPQRRGKA